MRGFWESARGGVARHNNEGYAVEYSRVEENLINGRFDFFPRGNWVT